MKLGFATLNSPVGTILLIGHGRVAYAVDFEDCEARMRRFLIARFGTMPDLSSTVDLSPLTDALSRYFDGDARAFWGLDMAPGGTRFQSRVWAALAKIPYGETRRYGEIAAALGSPGAARAVGHANGRNPVALIIPCHRVIGADGRLTGYAGGITRKRWLLNHEETVMQQAA